jgi:hypothetical protein
MPRGAIVRVSRASYGALAEQVKQRLLEVVRSLCVHCEIKG